MPSLLPSAHGRLERRSFSFGRSRRMKPACSPSECSRAAAASSSPPVQSTHDAADRPRERVPLRRAQSFERKAPPPLAGAPLRSSLSFGRKPRPRACQLVAPPVGISQMSGDLWKRAGIKYLKRFFFIVAGKLYYRDPSDESNNFFCGQVTGVKLYSTEMLEFSITTETREYSFRAETAGQVELWVETCEALLAGEPMKAKLPRGMPPPLPDRVGESLDPSAVPVVGQLPHKLQRKSESRPAGLLSSPSCPGLLLYEPSTRDERDSPMSVCACKEEQIDPASPASVLSASPTSMQSARPTPRRAPPLPHGEAVAAAPPRRPMRMRMHDAASVGRRASGERKRSH
ncbi:hypothetical protein AB1Y20_013771 [Prymnesium parvum]|uniref:PH domain-containing protein n=1 Tax=Prymnesium parvum TaxID=97485 RepID=A0AB34IHU6_PRYPA|mmetsp:Transcript_35554/g.88461  ORF Transcript_35554/g.88461 Transcript_35554/m.88461 type:complete len:344 (-) Transcript_35554:236-1267(-)